LYAAVEPYLRPDSSVLDIGCGYAEHPVFQGTILPGMLRSRFGDGFSYHGVDIRPEVIDRCRLAYPWGRWTAVDASMLSPLEKYDAVFHLGFDRKDLSTAWVAHLDLLNSGNGPRVALLEAGSPTGKTSWHIESFREVRALYESAGYACRANGAYFWEVYKITQPERRWAVMERVA